MTFDKSQTVREIAITNPAAVRIFENFGIDYCCGGKRPHSELGAIQDSFVALSQELFAHMMKEERVLFPFLDAMEAAVRAGQAPPLGCFASVELPIARMLADHDDAGALLAKMRDLSCGYRAPDGSCPSYRGLYQALEEFERDLHHHVHLENNILFPLAAEIERSLKEMAHVSR